MNFFGHSGFLSIADGKSKQPVVEVMGVKSLHSSAEDLDNNEGRSGVISKYGSLSRQQKSGQIVKNRKNNPDFRSVWYDEDAEYDQASISSSTKSTYADKSAMRKAISMDNLLDYSNKSRFKLRKSMISSPLRPRKIQGDWTHTKDMHPAEEAFLTLGVPEDADKPSIKDQRSDTTGTTPQKLECTIDADGVESDKCEVSALNVEELSDTYEDSSKEHVLVSIPVETLESNGSALPTTVENSEVCMNTVENNDSVVTEMLPSVHTNALEDDETVATSLPLLEDDNIAATQTSSPLLFIELPKDNEIVAARDSSPPPEDNDGVGTETSPIKPPEDNISPPLPQNDCETSSQPSPEQLQKDNETITAQTSPQPLPRKLQKDNEIIAPQTSPQPVPRKLQKDNEIIAPQTSPQPVPRKLQKDNEIIAPQTSSPPSPGKPQKDNEITASQTASPSSKDDEVIAGPAPDSQIAPTIIEPKPTKTAVNTFAARKVVVNKREKKKKKGLPNTIDNQSNKRNKKIEISLPTLPKKILPNGEVIDMNDIDTQGVTNLLRMKEHSKSTNELLKSFNQIKNEKLEHLNDPKFPISESDEVQEEVQIRRHQNINQYRFSKTTDFDFGRKIVSNNADFEIRACTKIQIPNESSPINLEKNETIKYQNGHFYRIYKNSSKILRSNVVLKGARLLNKREVELKDSHNLTYTVFFNTSKDAKLFIENENVSRYVGNDNKSTITRTLLRLLGKRSSREVLEKKGIYQNEPIFGNTLRNIYSMEKNVPDFILRTIELIENPENITSLGLYRTSGNLATIQKIRFEVDKGRLNILNEFCKDVDVLTGSLKLFFRELKEPLIPYEICDSLLNIIKTDKKYSKKDRDKIRLIISKLPKANADTLHVLVKHLTEVVKYKDENKMDTYNLSVCWGPTVIFITDNTENANGKDLVTQSTDATRLFDALLTFYIEHPEELDFSRKRQEYFDSNKNPIQRQDSKDSIRSSDSNNSKVQKKSASNLSLNVDEVLKKAIELIELNIRSEGLYKKSGSTEKIGKIMKKMTKKKVCELEKYKSDTNELTDSLKKYLRDFPEPLATKECVEQTLKFCDNTPCLEQNNRQKIIQLTEDLPKKDMLIYLIRHIIKVMEHESYHNVSKADMVSIWTNVLNYQRRIIDSYEKFSIYLRIVLEVFDETRPDITPTPKGIANGLLNDLKNYQKDKDRCSKYDNVPEMDAAVPKEATILEEKTDELEFTKL